MGGACDVLRVDTQPPTAATTAPAAQTTLGGTAIVTANASDNVGVTKAELYIDGTLAGPADTAAPYVFSWDTTSYSNADHSLTVKAYDAAGNTKISDPVTIIVNNAVPPLIPGDTDGDGLVNVSDLSRLAANYCTATHCITNATRLQGDFNGDRIVTSYNDHLQS